MKRAFPAVGALAAAVLLSACGPATVHAATSTSAPAADAAPAAATATTAPSAAPAAARSRQDALAEAQQELAARASTADATWATDHTDADWNQQAARKTRSYVSSVYFNTSSLHHQLRYDGFTEAQARYGMSQVGVSS